MIDILRPLRRQTPTGPPRPRIDLGTFEGVLYAIGDIHGCFDEFRRLEELILADGRRYDGRKIVILLGDYIDRGPRSAEVIAHLLQPLDGDFDRLCLCGNHEEMMLNYLDDPAEHSHWPDVGGRATLVSYGIDLDHMHRLARRDRNALRRHLAESIPEEHQHFLRSLPALVHSGTTVFVHAGLRPSVPLEAQTDRDLLWIREPFLSRGPQLPLNVVHGHSPTDAVILQHGRIGIDTGVFITGRLTALRLAGGAFSFLTSRGRD
ncbi:serine/threonine protein phosphatase [Aureimonas endophytica]|uniref:Serine/threonine protein phosphatase n=1 Tax=Aureimonas endophytica TaxID=2027858 RepID=A0A916ZJR5_9HYPH|nr:metallophosphoesterase family protein [Aureimonas endophytica]GGE01042.1 serine/threonine protein phosphatase [Aureimonas endophytica]